MALAAAMVLAALYGCSSGVSQSTHDRVKDDNTTLQGTVDAVAMALGLAAGSSEADILTALASATEDQLVAIRTALDLAADATASDIVSSIGLLQVDELVDIRTQLGLPADATVADVLAAIGALQTPVVVAMPEDTPAMAGNADIDAGESATIGYVTYSCAAGGADCTVTVNADGVAVSTGGMVTAARSQAYTTKLEEMAATAATTTAALTKEAAMNAERAQTTDAGLGGTGATIGRADGNYELDIDNEDMTVTVTVRCDDQGRVDPDRSYRQPCPRAAAHDQRGRRPGNHRTRGEPRRARAGGVHRPHPAAPRARRSRLSDRERVGPLPGAT